jgi:hypothetical protein
MDYLLSAEIENINSVKEATHDNRTRVWKQWFSWLEVMGLSGDPSLTRLTDIKKTNGRGVCNLYQTRGV